MSKKLFVGEVFQVWNLPAGCIAVSSFGKKDCELLEKHAGDLQSINPGKLRIKKVK